MFLERLDVFGEPKGRGAWVEVPPYDPPLRLNMSCGVMAIGLLDSHLYVNVTQ